MPQNNTAPGQSDLKNKRKAIIGIIAVFFTQFVSFLFINARNIAQPAMVAEFNGIALFSWLIALQALSGASGTLLGGKMSDIYGRRAVLLASLAIFTAGLAITTLSGSMIFAVAAYTFMSFGHWPIIPLCFSAVGDLFSPAERAKWTGLLNIPSSLAAAIGPTLGGLLTESSWGWRGV